MPHHEELLRDPLGVARRVWDDTGWRAAIIAAVLIFLFETFTAVASASVGGSIGWSACLISIVILARIAAMRPVRGALLDSDNLSLLLGIALLLIAEVLISYTTIWMPFVDAPITWPISVLLGGAVLLGRAIAPCATRPLVAWPLLYLFMYFWMSVAMWTAQAAFPDPAFTWSVAITAFALIARWIVGRGFGGPAISSLNVSTGLFILLSWWFEYGVDKSGLGADPWGYQELYWPWMVFSIGIVVGSAALAPHIARRLGASDEADQ